MSGFGPRSRRTALASLAIFALAGGIAYAAIPDAGSGAFHACMLKGIGTLRIIDPERQRCASFETPITLGAQGIQGVQGVQGLRGPAGTDGSNGRDGGSPTVLQLTPGDSNCPAGGAAITDAKGSTAYVCSGTNGRDGTNGQPFSGTFTSSDGTFSLSVSNSGVEISGPGARVSLTSGGTVSVTGDRIETVANAETITVHGSRNQTVDNNDAISVGANRTATVGNNESISVGGSRTATVGSNETISVAANRTETVGANLALRASGVLNLVGSLVTINGGGTGTGACQPAVRITDAIKSGSPFGVFVSDLGPGSSTVCIGG